MTEPTSSVRADDVINGEDDATLALDRRADLLLGDAESRAFTDAESLIAAPPRPASARPSAARPESVRQAVRDDLGEGREWVKRQTASGREAVRDHPLKATLYAMGAGVLLGLLIAR